MALVDCYPIGVISMLDNGAPDDKIISIPFNDPTDISQLPQHIFDEMIHFFSVYKTLENKETVIDEAKGVIDAISIIEEAIQAYSDKYGKNG